MKTAAIIESRMSSRRLPGKNMKPILGRPMIAQLIDRLKACENLDTICLATSVESSDDILEEVANAEGIKCFRGSLEDVLDRTLNAAKFVQADVIVEITGDCPLACPKIIDSTVQRYEKGDVDYIANMLDVLTFPIGFDVQTYATTLLEEVSHLTNSAFDRGNVTPYIYTHPDQYRLLNLQAPACLNRPEYLLCVDYQEDFELVTKIFEHLQTTNRVFTAKEIVAFLDTHTDPLRASRNDGTVSFPSSGGRSKQEIMTYNG